MNRVELIGRITKDIEIKKTQGGDSVTQITLAVDRRYKKEGQPEADFIQCVVWKQAADFLGQYAHKGTLISLEGRIQTRTWQNQQGQNMYATEVIAEAVSIMRQPADKPSQTNNQPPQHNYPEHSDSYDEFRSTQNLNISSDDLPFY